MKHQYVAFHVYRHKPIGEIELGSKSNAPNKQSEKDLKQRHIKGKKTLTRLNTILIYIFFFHKQPKFLRNKIK